MSTEKFKRQSTLSENWFLMCEVGIIPTHKVVVVRTEQEYTFVEYWAHMCSINGSFLSFSIPVLESFISFSYKICGSQKEKLNVSVTLHRRTYWRMVWYKYHVTKIMSSSFLYEFLDDASSLKQFKNTENNRVMTMYLNMWSMVLKNTLGASGGTLKATVGKIGSWQFCRSWNPYEVMISHPTE